MSKLIYEKKLKLLRDTCDEYKITAYEIGEATGLDKAGVQRILNGDTKKPRESTLDQILEFLETRIVGIEIPGTANYMKNNIVRNIAEPDETIKTENKILDAIARLEAMVRRDHEAIAEGVHKTYNNTKTLLKDTNSIQELIIALRE